MQKYGGAVSLYEHNIEELRSRYLKNGTAFPYIVIPEKYDATIMFINVGRLLFKMSFQSCRN